MKITNFAVIQGTSVSIHNGIIKYEVHKEKDQVKKTIDNVRIRSDASLGDGTFEFMLTTKSPDIGVLAVLRNSENKEVRCGYSRTYEKFLISTDGSNGWTSLSEAGHLAKHLPKKDINFKIETKGSSIKLFVDNIILCEAHLSLKESPLEFALSGLSNFEISNIQISSLKQSIFVVMQFSNDYNDLYNEVIKPVTEQFGYVCVRADEYYTGTPILKDIITSIQSSTAIIAEITPDNPNVFYEIGYSHAIGKPTILLCDKKRDKLPFDLSSFRTLFYENTIAGKKKVETSLRKYLENL